MIRVNGAIAHDESKETMRLFFAVKISEAKEEKRHLSEIAHLMQSHLAREGATYEEMGSFALGPSV